ncbi:MAG: DinB family protein [Blastocatellia bacterium]
MTSEQASFLRDFLLNRVEEAHIVTLRVLRSIPDYQRDYRPNPSSRSARELAWHIVSTELQLLGGIANGSFSRDDEIESPPESISEMAEYYEERFGKRLESIRKLNVKKLTNYLSFYGVFRYPAVVYLTFLHDHTVHHRGQLSSYAREMGSRISMLKGRNGDDVSINQPAMKYLWAERNWSEAELANAA